MFHGSSIPNICGFFGRAETLCFRLHSFASVSKTKHSMVTKVTIMPSSRKKSCGLFTNDEIVFGSQLTEPLRWVKEVNKSIVNKGTQVAIKSQT